MNPAFLKWYLQGKGPFHVKLKYICLVQTRWNLDTRLTPNQKASIESNASYDLLQIVKQGPISFIFYKRRLLLGKKDKVDMERGVGKKKQEPPVFWSSFLFGLVRLVDFSSQAHSTTTLLLQPNLWGMKKNGFHFSLSRFLHLLLFSRRIFPVRLCEINAHISVLFQTDTIRNPTIFHSSTAQHAELDLNKIEKTLNGTYAGWKSMHHGFRIYFVWNPRLKAIEFPTLAD